MGTPIHQQVHIDGIELFFWHLGQTIVFPGWLNSTIHSKVWGALHIFSGSVFHLIPNWQVNHQNCFTFFVSNKIWFQSLDCPGNRCSHNDWHSHGTMVQATVMSTLFMDSRFNKQLHPIVKRHPWILIKDELTIETFGNCNLCSPHPKW